jgi:NADH-quinone oxidoreductase subunit M
MIAALGLITGAAYSLLLMQRSFQGEPDESRRLNDFGTREMLTMALMVVALIGLGLYPQPVLDMAQPVLDGLLQFSATVAGGRL